MRQKLLVTGWAPQWGFSDPAPGELGEFGGDKIFQGGDHAGVYLRIGDHSCSAIHLFFACFKLGFDQGDDTAADAEEPWDRRQDQSQADEGAVGHRDIEGRGVWGELIEGEAPGVGAFPRDDPRILSEFPGQLSVSHIHGMDGGCAVLEQAIGETSGAGTQVDALTGVDRNGEMLQGVFEFVAASGNVTIPAEQFDRVTVADPIAGFFGGVPVDPDLSGHDGTLGLRTGFAKTAVHQGLIDTGLQLSRESARAGLLRQSPIAGHAVPVWDRLL